MGFLTVLWYQGRKIIRLTAQLDNAALQGKRLTDDLLQRQQEQQVQQITLENTRQQLHAIEKQLQVAQTDSRHYTDQLNELQARLQQSENTVVSGRAEIEQFKTNASDKYEKLMQAHQMLSNEHTQLKTALAGKEGHFKEQLQQLADARLALTQEFENLAQRIFEEKSKSFMLSSQSGINNLLIPFREQIEGFQKRINEVHDVSIKGHAGLNAEIKKMLDIGLHISKEANNLSTALKGDSQQRGAWGEAQLQRTLEMSGLVEKDHFEAQSAFKDAEGRLKRTDYLIKLPDNRHIIIDSKVTLVAYDKMIAAANAEAYQAALQEHVKAVRKHIDDLAAKEYIHLPGMQSPSFVLMFMPIEPAYIEVLKNCKDLFDYGYNKGIILVSHTTLIPVLRTVANLWMLERSNTEAREISEKAGEIFNQVCVVAERLQSLGSKLGSVCVQYNETVTALSGQRGLYGKVDNFNMISAKVSKQLPTLEPLRKDLHTEMLGMIVEPMDSDRR